MYQKFKFKTLELFCDTPEETRDTQMCRDTMVENHLVRVSEKDPDQAMLINSPTR